MQYADGVAKLFLRVADVGFQGAAVYNIKSTIVDMAEVVSAIESAVPAARATITYDPPPPLPRWTGRQQTSGSTRRSCLYTATV